MANVPTVLTNYYPALAANYAAKQDNALAFYSSEPSKVNYLNNSFATLAGLINSYFSTDSTNVFESTTGAIYNYLMASRNIGAVPIPDEEGTLACLNLFQLNGMYDYLIAQPVTLFGDVVEIITPPPSITSASIEALIVRLTDALNKEFTANNAAVLNTINTSAKNALNLILYDDPPAATAPIGKRGLGEFIFNTLDYKHAVQYMNIDFQMPSYITP